MSLRGITFDYQVPTARSFRSIFGTILSDGWLDGGKGILLPRSSPELTINGGYFIANGGVVQIDEQVRFMIVDPSVQYVRIIMRIDTSQASTRSTFAQASFVMEQSNTLNGFRSLQQDAINEYDVTGVYEAEAFLGTVSQQFHNIAPLRIPSASPKLLYGDTLPNDAIEGTIFLVRSTE